jgi:WXXGXW repeat (2 copies)
MQDNPWRVPLFTKKVLVSAFFAAGVIGAVATPLTSSAQAVIYLDAPPPAVRYEVVPAPRTGYVWSNGNWQYNGSQHVWTEGAWQAERPGYIYSQPRWVEDNGRWGYQASRWDRDGDGVPNRNDARPNDPTRR